LAPGGKYSQRASDYPNDVADLAPNPLISHGFWDPVSFRPVPSSPGVLRRVRAHPGHTVRGPGARSAERSELALEGGASTWQLVTLGLIDRRIYPQILPKTLTS